MTLLSTLVTPLTPLILATVGPSSRDTPKIPLSVTTPVVGTSNNGGYGLIAAAGTG